MTIRHPHFCLIAYIAISLLLSACTAQQFGREFETTFGSFAHEHVEDFTASGQRFSLVKLRFSNEYAVVSETKWELHLGKKFTNVRTVQHFADRDTHYTILACTGTDGALQNVLLIVPPTISAMAAYDLHSNSANTFKVNSAAQPVQLIQTMSPPSTELVWWLENGVRGPKVVELSEGTTLNRKQTQINKKKTISILANSNPATQSYSTLPPINPTATVRVEEPARELTPPATNQAKPEIILDP